MGLFDKRKDKVESFQKLTRNKTKKETRQLEEHMLEPEPIPTYTGENPEIYGIDALTVSIVFPNEEIKKLFGKYLKISYSKVRKQQYITDISMLINLVKQMDKGRLFYKNNVFKSSSPSRKTKNRRLL